MLDSKTYHKVYNQVAMRYRRFNRDQNWRTETVIDGLTFKQALSRALEDEEKRQVLGVERHEVKAKPRPEPVEMPNLPIQLLPEKPQEQIKKENLDVGSFQTKKHDNVGFDDLEDLLKETFGNPSLEKHIQENKALEKAVNESLERQITSNLCPICKSSVCHCEREE